MTTPHVGLVGERDLAIPAHAGIEASIELYRSETGRSISYQWFPTHSLTVDGVGQCLRGATGIWCVPGSPYTDTAGALRAIRFARTTGLAFLGTCGGFQHALMEYSSVVLGRASAHQELDPLARDPLIIRLSCSLAGARAKVVADPLSWYSHLLGASERVEEFNCNYGLSPGFEHHFAGSPMEVVARDEAGQVLAVRLRNHPFFVGTLFQPERAALRGCLHPLVGAFFQSS
jgi:CTP synthase (UTP-ammonia lyase)